MTTVQAAVREHATRRGTIFGDSWVMTIRLIKQIVRVPDLLVFSIVQPVLFVLLFRYVFGGSIDVGGSQADYVDYLMPGIFVQTLLFNGAATGIGMADDVQKGLFDRFRSLPMSRAAILLGRAVSDLIRATLIFLIMLGVGMLTGFRFSGGFWGRAVWRLHLVVSLDLCQLRLRSHGQHAALASGIREHQSGDSPCQQRAPVLFVGLTV